MKILIFNGSPRHGNTYTAVLAMKEALEAKPDTEVEVIDAEGKKIVPCQACNACFSMSRCIFADDSPAINDSVEAADAIVFATPVYWWGMTAQLKLIVDKFFARFEKFKGPKKVGSIVIGGESLEDPEYRMIHYQIELIGRHLGWNKVFEKSISASKPSDLKNSPDILEEVKALADKLL